MILSEKDDMTEDVLTWRNIHDIVLMKKTVCRVWFYFGVHILYIIFINICTYFLCWYMYTQSKRERPGKPHTKRLTAFITGW